jgi:hypothetical protein
MAELKTTKESNLLSVRCPELIKEWHPTKNGTLTPHDVTLGSNKKVWWKCSKGHEWQTTTCKRSRRGYGCPYCSGARVCADNSLYYCNRKIAKEWHPTKNGTLTPHDVTSGSGKKVWWKCSKGHEWRANIGARARRGDKCPYCAGVRVCDDNSLQATHPELAKEWHPTKNGELAPNTVTHGSNKKVWWSCVDGHEWQAPVSRRSAGHGCPYCSGKRSCMTTSIAYKYKDLMKEWHPTKNKGKDPFKITKGSDTEVWWKCSKGHEWQTPVNWRLQRKGKVTECPYCCGRLTSNECSLQATHPELAKEWHPTKNGELTPDKLRAGSNTNVWWKCSKGHEWQKRAYARMHGNTCPHCRLEENNLRIVRPRIALQWHPIKNKDKLPEHFRVYSRKEAWWLCDVCGHEWRAKISNRNSKRGCAKCYGVRSKSKRILFNLLNIWTTKEWPYASAGKLDVCDMIMTELDFKGYNDLNFLSLPGNGREIHELVANGFELNYAESLGVERNNVKALREYFLTLFKKGELKGLLPIVRDNIDELVIRNENLPEFNAIHLDYNGPLIHKHILAVEAALQNNPEAIVAVTVNRQDRYNIAVDYKFGDFPFINMNPELLFYQPYEGKKPMPWKEGTPMETYCFKN